MKKNFLLVSERHKPARLGDQIKGEVRKYLKRERSKKLPEGVDYWGFACRSGKSSQEAVSVHEKEIGKAIDAALEAGWESFYLEILAKEGRRGTQDA